MARELLKDEESRWGYILSIERNRERKEEDRRGERRKHESDQESERPHPGIIFICQVRVETNKEDGWAKNGVGSIHTRIDIGRIVNHSPLLIFQYK